MTGFVYAIVSGETVKIGWSSAPALRVAMARARHDLESAAFVMVCMDCDKRWYPKPEIEPETPPPVSHAERIANARAT